MRTTIKQTAATEVTLNAEHPMTGEEITRVFWVPTNGGYVREGDTQVCEGLSDRGYTLEATDGADLLAVIRAEWAKFRRNEERAA